MNKILHIISVGNNGGENIIQKYINYIKVYNKLNYDYKLIVIAPIEISSFDSNNNIIYIKNKTVSNKCQLKRVWINAIVKLESLLKKSDYSYLILRMDFVDKNILNFIKKYQPILEYPTPPIETTLKSKPFYHKLALKYNKKALKYSKFNITIMDVGYSNSYIFPNSLFDNHVKKNHSTLNKEVKILLMSSKYGKNEYNGYDRFLKGLEKFVKTDEKYKITLLIAGKDIDGFKGMINDTLEKNITIKYLGFKKIDFFNNIIDDINLGVNDLAFHRLGLNKANTLKTIDFLGWNLPFLISHKDVNIKKDQRFYFKVSEDDSEINISKVIKFLKTLKQEDLDDMRKYSYEISLENRIKSFIDFLESSNVSN